MKKYLIILLVFNCLQAISQNPIIVPSVKQVYNTNVDFKNASGIYNSTLYNTPIGASVTTAQMNAITNPKLASWVYNTTDNHYYYYNGTTWVKNPDGGGSTQQFAQTVYFNSTSPSTANIFDTENPPLTDNTALQNLDNAIYIGSNSSTWSSNGTVYSTYTAPSTTAWYINGTTTDNGANKIGDIQHKGDLFVGLDGLVRVGYGKSNIASNTAVGGLALGANTTGASNSASGYGALQTNTTGNFNTATGNSALRMNTTGSGNTATGVNALFSNTTGGNNMASGMSSMRLNTTGSGNTANGTFSLSNNTTGTANTALGYSTLQTNAVGINNTAVGYASLNANTASQNTATGHYSLSANTTGANNVANGAFAMASNNTGGENSSFGMSALRFNTTGNYNTSVGSNSMYNSIGGQNNNALGYRALYSNTNGSNNVAIGRESQFTNLTNSYNTSVGNYSLEQNTADNNTAVGAMSMRQNTTGIGNAALGISSLRNNTTGSNNTGLGAYALNAVTTSNANTGVGTNSFYKTTTGANNTGVGYASGSENLTGNGNSYLGGIAGRANTTGSYNSLVGYESFAANTTGLNNVGLGYRTFNNQTAGDGNVAIGTNAGNTQITGSNNIVVGNTQRLSDINGSNQLNIAGAIFGTGLSGSVTAPTGNIGINQVAPAYNLDVNGTARIATVPTITTATKVLVKDPTTGQISEQVVNGGINAITTIQPTPTLTGNTTNLNTTFKDANGDTWIVDGNGDAVLTASIVPPSTVVLDNSITDPTTITDAGRYIVPATGGTGVFVGHANQYADFDGTNWTFTTPTENDRVSITTGVNSGNIYNYVGSVWTLGAPSSTALDYTKLNRTSNVVSTANTIVKFNAVEAGNLPYNSTTGFITLKAGKLYELETELGLSASAATSWHEYQWHNYSTNTGIGNKAFCETGNTAATTGANTIAKAVIQPTSDIIVGVRILNVSATGTPNIRGGYAYAMVKQLGTTLTSPAPISRSSFAYVPRGTAVTLGNLSVRVATTAGIIRAEISTAVSAATLRGSAYGVAAGAFSAPNAFVFTSNPVGTWNLVQLANSNFNAFANLTEHIFVTDTANKKMYRVTIQYEAAGGNQHFITIELIN